MTYDNFLNEKNPKVKLTMENGKTMIIELFPEIAPITANNFLDLVKEKFYDGLIFHRVIPGFMIQGGDPEGTGFGGSDICIKGEFESNGYDNPIDHTRGVISMARSSDPNSASSQFFIMHADAPYLNMEYAAFGAVIEGMDTVDEIANTKTTYNDLPVQKQIIKTVEII